MLGTLFVVATPIGNLEDITARALRVLREVAVIAAEDTRRTMHLLARHAISTPITSLHEHNEAKKTPSLIARMQQGDAVALVSDAGTPTISDPGQRLIREAIGAGLRVEPIPGPSAVLTALAASGLPSDRFTFLGFPPIRSKDRQLWLTELHSAGRTVIFFESPHRIRETLKEVLASAGDRRVAVGRELTKTHEQFLRGPISKVLTQLNAVRGECTVVVDIGQSTESEACIAEPGATTDKDLLIELGQLAITDGIPRRRAINLLARRYHLPPNEVYAAIERAKKSIK